jgi:RHS repeat-associated protein
VLADNGAWHQFTVAAFPAAVAWSLPGASRPPVRPQAGLLLAGAGLLGLLARTVGVRRRRRLVIACALLFLLGAAPALAQTTTQVIEYYSTDAIGSVRAVTKQVNGTWQVVARHDFMPFGEEVAPQYPPPDKRLFTGKERDHETGLDYFEARYLRTEHGRFTTVDPAMTLNDNLVDPQRWNRYAYVTNNPLRFTDPDGRDRMGIYAYGFKPTPWRGLWEEAKSIGAVAAVFAAPVIAPELAQAAVGCFLRPACQQTALDLIAPEGSPSLNVGVAKATLGFSESAGAIGTMIGGELKAGGTAMVSLGRAGESLLANVSLVKGPAGTLGRLEAGLTDLARREGASALRVTASMVTPEMARLLRRNGFTAVLKDGKETGDWVKTIQLLP